MQAVSLTGIVIFLLVSLLLFLVFRMAVLWYWKIDKIVSLLEEVRDNTKKKEE